MESTKNIPGFREELLSEPFVQHLLNSLSEVGQQLDEANNKIDALEKEVRLLKKLPAKPDLKASKLDEPYEEESANKSTDDSSDSSSSKKLRAGSSKRKKRRNLRIDEHKKVLAVDVPSDWKFVGYRTRVIEDLIVRSHNTAYQLEIWQSPDGKQQIVAPFPAHLSNTHFGPTLKAYILHQYYSCCVTQPLLLQALRDFGVDISSGQLNNILIENKEAFHLEKERLLVKAIELSEELRTDDTGARHAFKNGYCNCINNDLFTYFTTTYKKSRINFLEILNLGHQTYYLNQTALDYVEKEKLPPKYLEAFKASLAQNQCYFSSQEQLEAYFKAHSFTAKYACRIMTEALLLGNLVENGFNPKIGMHSDGARQFNLFTHSLCWKHAERPLLKIKCHHSLQTQQLATKKKAFWMLYQALKKYKANPDKEQIPILEKQFDQLCEPVDYFEALSKVLGELKTKKEQLLLVLEKPKTSLHNNDSERDIREYAKRRKISAGTRSENGKKARDTFLSLKKTCRKLEVSFWQYLNDRLQQTRNILPLDSIMENKLVNEQ